MTTPTETLAELHELQEQAEHRAAKLLHAVRCVKVSLKTNPLSSNLPDALRELRREADHIKTLAHQLNKALLAHADAEFDAERPKRSRNISPGVKVRRKMAKRGCFTVGIETPRFGL